MEQHPFPSLRPPLPVKAEPQPTSLPGALRWFVSRIAWLLILGILLGMGVSLVTGMALPSWGHQGTKILHSKVVEQSLVVAIKGYQIEFGHLPVPSGTEPRQGQVFRMEGAFLHALLGEDEGGLNPRQIVFLSPPTAKDGRNGLRWNARHVPELVDPWGHAYYVIMDTTGSGTVPDPEHPGQTLAASVIVYSAGPDGKVDTWQDNPCSWR